ncbi:MAG: hypothetical protein ABIO68_05075, partial [Sphingomicrobium sp.]
MFETLRFSWRFFRARLREIKADFRGSAALLDQGPVPERYRSLRDAYRLRMLVLAHAPEQGPEIIQAAEALDWFREPQSAGDEYARDYCRYFAAGVRGDVPECEQRARELRARSVKRVYRNA